MRCLVVAVVFALGSACAAPVPKDFKKPDDKTLIVGTWVLTRANLNGQENAEYFWHSMTFDADGNTRFRYKTIPDQENERRWPQLQSGRKLRQPGPAAGWCERAASVSDSTSPKSVHSSSSLPPAKRWGPRRAKLALEVGGGG